MSQRILVIGGGVAGSVCALRLRQHGLTCSFGGERVFSTREGMRVLHRRDRAQRLAAGRNGWLDRR